MAFHIRKQGSGLPGSDDFPAAARQQPAQFHDRVDEGARILLAIPD